MNRYKEIKCPVAVESTGFVPLGTDEIMVRIADTDNLYISNYGRVFEQKGNSYKLRKTTRGNKNTEILCFTKKIGDNRVSVHRAIDRLVADAFLVYNGEKDVVFFHSADNREDKYYRNIYPVTLPIARRLKGRKDLITEEQILNCIAELEKAPNIEGVGYVGDEYIDTKSKVYRTWQAMIQRCYSPKYQEKCNGYKDVTVSEEFLYFPNFRKWYEENYYEIPTGEKMQLDKDLLSKEKKIYSPETACFLPVKINSILASATPDCGRKIFGVKKAGKRFRVQLHENGKYRDIGYYDTVEEAFNVYKGIKEQQIHALADEYKEYLPDKIYAALKRWEFIL